MTSRREPIAEPSARDEFERRWLYIGFAIIMFYCCMAVLGSNSAQTSPLTATEMDCQSLARADNPQARSGDHIPCSDEDIHASKADIEGEGATYDVEALASASQFELRTPDIDVRALDRVIPADTDHLLVSTGLSRGPPLG